MFTAFKVGEWAVGFRHELNYEVDGMPERNWVVCIDGRHNAPTKLAGFQFLKLISKWNKKSACRFERPAPGYGHWQL